MLHIDVLPWCIETIQQTMDVNHIKGYWDSGHMLHILSHSFKLDRRQWVWKLAGGTTSSIRRGAPALLFSFYHAKWIKMVCPVQSCDWQNWQVHIWTLPSQLQRHRFVIVLFHFIPFAQTFYKLLDLSLWKWLSSLATSDRTGWAAGNNGGLALDP